MNKQEKLFQRVIAKMKDKSYLSAADKFNDAILLADSPLLKCNALKEAVKANKKADMLFQEFECLKQLIASFPAEVNVDELVQREYEIGNKFYDGYREHPYWWMPWIENDDKTTEIYETIYKQLPFAGFVPEMLIKMGIIYLKGNKNQQAIVTYQRIIDNYNDPKACEIAYLDLANIYLQLAAKGDGDGSNTRKAREVLIEFIKKYPNSPELTWAKSNLKETYEIESQRLYDLAVFYNKKNNQKASKRYIKQILVNYPDTRSVTDAENLLDQIDIPLYPMTKLPPKEEVSKYKMYNLPVGDEEDSAIVSSENSGGKWLIPIDDLGIHKQKELQKKI